MGEGHISSPFKQCFVGEDVNSLPLKMAPNRNFPTGPDKRSSEKHLALRSVSNDGSHCGLQPQWWVQQHLQSFWGLPR